MSSSEASFIKMKRKKISSSHLQLVYAQTTADDRCLKPASLFAFFGGFLNSPSSIEDCRTTDSTIDGCDERLCLAQSSGRRYLSCVADIIHHRIPNSSRVWWKRATKKELQRKSNDWRLRWHLFASSDTRQTLQSVSQHFIMNLWSLWALDVWQLIV